MKSILCDSCKKVVGLIEEDALVCSDDQYYGIDIYCKECKKKRIHTYFYDVNQLLLNQNPEFVDG